MRSRHKTQNIDMNEVTGHDDLAVNILAFFYVVASSQISPHFPSCEVTFAFRAAKIVKFYDLQGVMMIFSEKTPMGISSESNESRELANKYKETLHKNHKICYLRGIKNLLFLTKTL